jgi:prepilin-type N-terminal cleavage/methylation domain-containing protein
MRRPRGFTLIEMAVTVAVVAIVAAAAVIGMRAARRNAEIGSASFDLVLQLQGLRTRALAEQQDHLAVIHGGDGGGCHALRQAGCVRVFVLVGPTNAWTLQAFRPANPGQNATELFDTVVLPRGVLLDPAAAMDGRPPFENVDTWDAELTADCGGARCAAFRFGADGTVRGEAPDGASLDKAGHIVALATDLQGETAAAERRAVLVSFPTGIVKSYTY